MNRNMIQDQNTLNSRLTPKPDKLLTGDFLSSPVNHLLDFVRPLRTR